MKKFFSGLLLFCMSLAVALLIGEGLVRLLYKDQINLFPRYHTDAQYGEFTLRRMRPNTQFRHTSRDGSWTFRINGAGLRNDTDFDYSKPSGAVRILALGDSHTQGYEVRGDFTFAEIIERTLQREGVEAQVINTGISGFSTAEELAYLENEGYKYHPDAVVLGFFANDFQDNLKAGLFRLESDGTLKVVKQEHIPGVRIQNLIYSLPAVKWLGEHSYFYSMLFNATWEFMKNRLTAMAEERVTDYAVPVQQSFSEYEYALAAALLQRLYDYCQKMDIPLVIIDIPQIADGTGRIRSSFTGNVERVARVNSDAFISLNPLLTKYQAVAEFHRPHGHRHITEFSHTLLGVAAAEELQMLLGNQAPRTWDDSSVSSP